MKEHKQKFEHRKEQRNHWQREEQRTQLTAGKEIEIDLFYATKEEDEKETQKKIVKENTFNNSH